MKIGAETRTMELRVKPPIILNKGSNTFLRLAGTGETATDEKAVAARRKIIENIVLPQV
jgi:hypothetical protein